MTLLRSPHQLVRRDAEGIGQFANSAQFGWLCVVLNPGDCVAGDARLQRQLILSEQGANSQHAEPREWSTTSCHKDYSHCTSIVHRSGHRRAIALRQFHECRIIVLRMHKYSAMEVS